MRSRLGLITCVFSVLVACAGCGGDGGDNGGTAPQPLPPPAPPAPPPVIGADGGTALHHMSLNGAPLALANEFGTHAISSDGSIVAFAAEQVYAESRP